MQLSHQFHNPIKNMKYNYVLQYTKGMKVHYLEFLSDKLRMEKGLKVIAEENSLTFPWCVKFFKKFPWLFQFLKDFLKKQCFSRFFRVYMICGNPFIGNMHMCACANSYWKCANSKCLRVIMLLYALAYILVFSRKRNIIKENIYGGVRF